jgi:hypothetical protein
MFTDIPITTDGLKGYDVGQGHSCTEVWPSWHSKDCDLLLLGSCKAMWECHMQPRPNLLLKSGFPILL